MKKTLFILLLCLPLIVFCQKKKYTSSHRRAIESYEKGLAHLYSGKPSEALLLFKKAAEQDPKFAEAFFLLGDLYADLNANEEAENYYKRGLEINEALFPTAWLVVGNLLMEKRSYPEALVAFEKHQALSTDEKERLEVVQQVAKLRYIIEAIGNPVPYQPINMGSAINTLYDEYLPYLTADGNTLIFTRRFPKEKTSTSKTAMEEDIYVSTKREGEWDLALRLPEPLNSRGNEGSQCISQDGRFLFFTACDRMDGFGSCDLYFSEKNGEEWSAPKNLGSQINTPQWESQPSLSIDGKTLYFASKREGGKGGSDIWTSTLNEDGEWQAPELLQGEVNTSGDEYSPFIHYDDQTLYFASSGHLGMGKRDLFLSRKQEDETWGKVMNLGYPINTEEDESGIVVDATGILAVTATDQMSGYGKHDLYTFTLYPEARPNLVSYMKGLSIDATNKKPVQVALVLIDMETGKQVASTLSDRINGEYLISIPTGKNYLINAYAEGYLFYSDHISFKEPYTQSPFLKDILMKPLEKGESLILKNVQFETNSFSLKEESKIELDLLVNLLQKNPQIKVEIGGHTDATGNAAANQKLSENRANAVYAYLLEQSISPNRLSYKGYGDVRPIDRNDTEEGKASNRRTECKIISIQENK